MSHNVLISAGPMRTYLDPIRYIQNSSSGLMALEIAKALKNFNVQMTTLLGPVDSSVQEQFVALSTVIPFETHHEYQSLLYKHFTNCDLFISAAAVLDFDVVMSDKKISREQLSKTDTLQLHKKNIPDFASWAGHNKKPSQKIFVFALESENQRDESLFRARKKLTTKNADGILLNYSTPDEGPEKAMSSGIILNAAGEEVCTIQKTLKSDVAKAIVSYLNKIIEFDTQENPHEKTL